MSLDVIGCFARGFTPADKRDIDEWAREHVVFTEAFSNRPGNFSTETAPWLVAPLKFLGGLGRRRLSLVWAAGSGKSTIGEVFALWVIDNSPSPFVWYAQTNPAAKEFAETRIQRIVESCERVTRWIPVGAARHAKKTQAIHMPHMSLMIQGANDTNTNGKHVRNLACDEVHLWAKGMLSKAHKRTNSYKHNRRIIEISTGSDKGDQMDQAYNLGTRQEWMIFCPNCKTHHAPKFTFGEFDKPGGVKWSQAARREDGTWDYKLVMESAGYECPSCRAFFAANSKNGYTLNAAGKYSDPALDAAPDHMSCHVNCIACDFSELGTIAVEFLEAKQAVKRADLEPLADFTRKRLAEAWEDKISEVTEIIAPGEYNCGDPWPDEAYRFFTVDVQDGHFWGVIRAWSKVGHSRLVWAGKMMTWGEVDEIRERFNVLPHYTFVDSGKWTDRVYTQVCFYGWYALKGDEAERGFRKVRPDGTAYWECAMFSGGDARRDREKYRPIRPLPGSKLAACELLRVSDTRTAESLHLFRTGVAEGWSCGKDTPKCHTEQVGNVFRSVEVGKNGKLVPTWKFSSKYGNHIWDAERYQIAAAVMAGILRGKTAKQEKSENDAGNNGDAAA